MGSDGTTDITRRLAMQAFEEMQSAPDRLAEAHRTIASQAEEIARLTAERDGFAAQADQAEIQSAEFAQNLTRMTERRAWLRAALVALEPCHQLPSYILAAVHEAIAADDDSGGEG